MKGTVGPIGAHGAVLSSHASEREQLVLRHVSFFVTVPTPYTVACRLLRDQPELLLQPATEAAAGAHDEPAPVLDVELGVFTFSKELALQVGEFEESTEPRQRARRKVRWEAAEHPGLYPVMDASIEICPLSGEEVQVKLVGWYRPPLSVVGAVADRLAMRRVADASLQRLFRRLAATLEEASPNGSS